MLLLLHLAISVWQNLPEEVGWCLPPSACLLTCLVWSGLVKCLQTALHYFLCFVFLFFSLSLSLFSLSLMTGMDGLYLSLPFHQYTTALALSVLPPCTTTILLLLTVNIWCFPPSHFPGIPQTAPCLCTFISV